MNRPKTQQAYIELVNQAIIDVKDLHSTIENDEEVIGRTLGNVERLENNLRALYMSLIGGSYQHVDEDLDYMEVVNTGPEVWLSFKPLLLLINQTHRQGLETE